MKKYLLVDMDDTLSDTSHRDHLAKMRDWDAFHGECINDPPITTMVELIRYLSTQYSIAILTGRPEKFRRQTYEWMKTHNVPIHELHMRPDDNYERAPELKWRMVNEIFGADFETKVAMIIDDHPIIVDKFRGRIVALQCHMIAGEHFIPRFDKRGHYVNEVDDD